MVTAEREDSDQIDDEAEDWDWQQTFVLDVRRLEYSLETKDIHETKCKIIREEKEVQYIYLNSFRKYEESNEYQE